MKLLHTSDWHLGMTLRNGLTYCEDQRFFIHEIGRVAIEEKVDGILLAGDIFDKSVASQEALRLYDEAMTYLCMTLHIPVYMVAGNHDGAERLSSCRELLKQSGLYIAGSLSKEPNVISIGDVDIFLLPWISTDKVKSMFPDEKERINSLEEAYKFVLDIYRERFREGTKKILVSHAFIVNAQTSVSDRAAEVGSATMVGAHVFEGFDYVALGHLHGPQKVNAHIRYSGTPMAYSFGKEEAQEKSVVILDTDSMEQKVVCIPVMRRRTTLEGIFADLLKADYPQEILDGYVRLNVTDSYVGLDSMAALKEKYKFLLEVTCKSFERDDAKITMTMEEFEQAETNPQTVFMRYCQDILEETPSDHMRALFEKACREYAKEVEEA